MNLQKPIVIRALCPDEREVLQQVAGTGSDEPQPKADHSIVVVAEIDRRIKVTITAERVWCVSNHWADPEVRGTGAAEEVARTIAAMNTEGLTEMLCTTNRHIELMAHRFGFVPIKGTLFRR
jgi:hypothetical protein